MLPDDGERLALIGMVLSVLLTSIRARAGSDSSGGDDTSVDIDPDTSFLEGVCDSTSPGDIVGVTQNGTDLARCLSIKS